jgi:mRNA-degrading endonuclease RelE of RelBE toxin-antitoxin system
VESQKIWLISRVVFGEEKGPSDRRDTMKKTKTSENEDRPPAGAFSKTIAVVQKALVDALPFDILAREEIAAIKSGLRDLRDGAVHIIPFFDVDALDELWLLDRRRNLPQESAAIEKVLPMMEDSSAEMRSEEEPGEEERQLLPSAQKEFPESPPQAKKRASYREQRLFKGRISEAQYEFDTSPKAEKAAWSIAMPETFTKSITGLDKKLQGRILEALGKIVKDPPKEIGDTVKPLSRDKKGLWRYRIGDYRLVYRPEVETSRIVLLTCGARGNVYD